MGSILGFLIGLALGLLGMYAFMKGIYKDMGGK
jgi:hypothetical protein